MMRVFAVLALVAAAEGFAFRPGRRSAMTMKTVNVGVIGAGRIGLVHLEALSKCPDVNPIIVSNPTVSKAEAAAQQFNVPNFSGTDTDVIENPDVDAVWICSPSSFHADQIKRCAAAGKHVFCEKPIATDLAETIEAINLCNQAGVKLFTALQRRFDPNFRRVKEAIEGGEVRITQLCQRGLRPLSGAPAPWPVRVAEAQRAFFDA
eukprot:scaffold1247_cov251-Pinguiococcus_pyrenoidosus.AAC.31